MSDSMQSLLTLVANGETLSRDEAETAMHFMMRGESEPELIAGLLLGLRSRGETIDELTGFAKVMREYAVPVELDDPDTIDLCGTGGDGSGTFNISTAVAFVCAGAGVPVAKHGNRSVSSRSGSSDVLASLGVKTNLDGDGVRRCLTEAGIAFLFAPLFHPALRHVMPVRRKLGVRTFFNILGPLCNPAGVRRQLIGAFSIEVAQSMSEILRALGAEQFVCVHSDDGLDEFSVSGQSTYFSYDAGKSDACSRLSVTPEELGFRSWPLSDIPGGDPATNAAIISRVLDGTPGPERDIVLVNAAFALSISGRYPAIGDAIDAATESIDSGNARASLLRLINTSNAAREN